MDAARFFLLKIQLLKTMWEEKNNALCRVFTFKNFTEAWAFMTEVAFAAEKIDHHPNWSNVWKPVAEVVPPGFQLGAVQERDD